MSCGGTGRVDTGIMTTSQPWNLPNSSPAMCWSATTVIPSDDEVNVSPAPPVAGNGSAPTPGRASRAPSSKSTRILCAVLAVVIMLAGFMPWVLKVSGDFTILPAQKVSVASDVEGTLKMIAAEEGHRTRTGEILATIENLDLSSTYEETRGELQIQRAALGLLRAGSRPEEIERARRQIETKKMELDSAVRVEQERKMLLETIAKKQAEFQNARLTHERNVELLKKGLVARNEADREQTAFEVQQRELSEAQGQLQVLEERTDNTRRIKAKELAQAESELLILLAGSRKESIQAVEAQVTKLEAQLKILSQQLAHLQIRSPIDGVVTTPHLKERIGAYLRKGDTFCDIASDGTVLVEMLVPEEQIADVRLGFPIMLKVRGYPGSSLSATVRAIAPIAVGQGLQRTVMVRGQLPNPDGTLKPGMTGIGKILCGKKTLAGLLTRRSIRWLRTEFWGYLP